MKKMFMNLFRSDGRHLKLLKIMRLSIYLLLITTFSLSARGFSQRNIVSLDVKNANLSSIIKEIRKVSDYRFLFRVEEVNKYGKRDFKVEKAKMDKVMLELLKGTMLSYSVDNGIIIIKPKNSKDKTDKKPVKGKVLDEKGNPLPGVSVIVKGTSVGVSTDVKGQFNIELPKDEKGITLVFSFIGMETQEIKLKEKDQKYIKVKLKAKKENLEEVIVNGFKSVKKEHFTGNATVVSKKDLLKTNSKSIISALQVFDPSFRIKENSTWGSDPNAMPEFNIRGESSIGMEKGIEVEVIKQSQRTNLKDNPNLPIFMIDGFEVNVQKVYDMDMNRIENITILKDAASTSLYGSRAANGVVLITTTSPKSGELRVNYNFTASVQLPDLSDYNLCNAAEKLEAEVFAGHYVFSEDNSGVLDALNYNKTLQDVLRGVNTDWIAQPLENVFNHKHSVFIEGGSGCIRYGADINYDSNSGVMKGSFRNRKSFGFHFDYNFNKLKIRNKITYNNTNSENSPYGKFSEYAKMSPYCRIYDDNGDLIENYDEYKYYLDRNPLYKVTLESYDGRTNYENITDNLHLEYSFNSGLRFKTQFSISKISESKESFIDPLDLKYREAKEEDKGSLSRSYRNDLNFNLKTLLTYNKKINKSFINIVGGFELIQREYEGNRLSYQGFQVGSLHSPKYAAQQKDKTDYYEDESRTVGFLGSFNYSYNDTYLLDGSFRYDGSSKFGSDKRFAPFWSVGVGLNVHKYDFMQSISWISRLKVRASYGSTGKVNFPSNTAITMYKFFEDKWFKTGAGSTLIALGNTDLKWETTNTLDAGFNLSLFNGKVNLKASYYDKRTVDLISDLYLRQASGFEKYKINSGEIQNKGYEVNINTILFRNENLIITAHGNISSNKNQITKLSKAMEEYNQKINESYHDVSTWGEEYYDLLKTRPIQQYHIGASTTAIYAVKSNGIDPSNGKERLVRRDGTATYTWDANDQVKCGDSAPDAQGSFGFNIGYKGIYVNASFMYKFGGQVYNSTLIDKIESVNVSNYNVDKRFLTDRWKRPGDIVPYLNIATDRIARPTSRAIQDENIVSFNSLSVGYDFKSKAIKKMGLDRLGLSLNMNDIARWSTIRLERGINYPYARNYSLNLNMSF